VADASRPLRGVIDTSVLIDLEKIDAQLLPRELAISALTLAELAASPHATDDADERARRQDRLQRTEATVSPLAFDADAARAYGRVFAEKRRQVARRAEPGPLI
jgi:predicted nucleic acid-binding protein